MIIHYYYIYHWNVLQIYSLDEGVIATFQLRTSFSFELEFYLHIWINTIFILVVSERKNLWKYIDQLLGKHHWKGNQSVSLKQQIFPEYWLELLAVTWLCDGVAGVRWVSNIPFRHADCDLHWIYRIKASIQKHKINSRCFWFGLFKILLNNISLTVTIFPNFIKVSKYFLFVYYYA